MKQDNILSFLFGIISLYFIGNAIFLFTLSKQITNIFAVVLIVLAFMFLALAYKFFKMSKQSNCFEPLNANLSPNNNVINDAQVTKKAEIENISATKTIKTDIDMMETEKSTFDNKQKIAEELALLKKQLKQSKVKLLKIIFDENVQKTAMHKFYTIALRISDSELQNNSISEICAVQFDDGKPVKRFYHQFDTMTYFNSEKEVLTDLMMFLSDAVNKQTFICSYNTDQEINQLLEAFIRNDFATNLFYLDICQIVKEQLSNLEEYSLHKVAKYSDISINEQLISEGEACGKILVKIIKKQQSSTL